MKQPFASFESSFLMNENSQLNTISLLKLSVYLNIIDTREKPYTIDYTTLLTSYYLWKGTDLDEFCQKQAISYFLFNPKEDSIEAREALYLDIREFLSGK